MILLYMIKILKIKAKDWERGVQINYDVQIHYDFLYTLYLRNIFGEVMTLFRWNIWSLEAIIGAFLSIEKGQGKLTFAASKWSPVLLLLYLAFYRYLYLVYDIVHLVRSMLP